MTIHLISIASIVVLTALLLLAVDLICVSVVTRLGSICNIFEMISTVPSGTFIPLSSSPTLNLATSLRRSPASMEFVSVQTVLWKPVAQRLCQCSIHPRQIDFLPRFFKASGALYAVDTVHNSSSSPEYSKTEDPKSANTISCLSKKMFFWSNVSVCNIL